ncbi:MAG: hypothetical protein GY749_08445 [Desulfobacteraceae bacterium]|nr:hypothetical protein [Desulfobacteraceae bacterium]
MTLKNVGKQDLPETEFRARITDCLLGKETKETIKAGETFNLSYVLPINYWFGAEDTRLNLSATKLKHPVHVWEFPELSIILPRSSWQLYILLATLFLATVTGVYYLYIYHHPITTNLSKTPENLISLPLEQLFQAKSLLKGTRRLETVLSVNSIQSLWLDQTIAFHKNLDTEERCKLIMDRLGTACEPINESQIPIFKFHMGHDFMFNMDFYLIAFPPDKIRASQVLRQLSTSSYILYHFE